MPVQPNQSKSELSIPEATSSPHGTLKGNQPLKGIGKFFGNSKKQDQLGQILQSWKVNGMPLMPDLLVLGHKKFNQEIFDLEGSWTDLVQHKESCDRYQQEAIWELLKTEVAYIKDLQLVINMFLACLYNLQTMALLNDVETEKIFSNIADLHLANCEFYETHMYKIIQMARETGEPLDPIPLIQGFIEFRTYFEPYSKFCIEYMACQLYLSRMKEENELFRFFLLWAENQRQCNRLSLRDYIGKPFQRLTKYKLLLERIWREPTRPDNIQEMINKVDHFICRVNATVTQLEIMRRIDSYDAVDMPNNDVLAKMVGPFCRLDLTRPIHGTSRTRFLVEEGSLRMNNKTDVICFLFSDMLLITKATSRKPDGGNKVKVKVYKPPMRLDKVYVNPLADGGFMLVYLNEYNLATTAYTFQGEHSRLWLERIQQTQEEYEKLRCEIMDQSEAYFLNLASQENYEDDFAYLNARSVAMELGLDRAGINRHPSVSSADTYMTPHRKTSRPDSANPVSMANHLEHERSYQDSPSSTPLVTLSSNGSASSLFFQTPQEVPYPVTTASESRAARRFYKAPTDLPPPSPGDSKQYPLNQVPQDSLKKLKQRRDRRYFTADMIQDLHQGKDASIQKRLSWHSGAKDTDYEYKQFRLNKTTSSSGSLRSVHSSSGVSSVSSLHNNPDTPTKEGNTEWVVGDSGSETSSQASDTTTKTKTTSDEPQKDHTEIIPPADPIVTHTVNKKPTLTEVPEVFGPISSSNLTSQSKVSKSMPDISQLSLEGDDLETGQSGVISLIRDNQRRKLSDSQSKRLKLQILNSTLEATDV